MKHNPTTHRTTVNRGIEILPISCEIHLYMCLYWSLLLRANLEKDTITGATSVHAGELRGFLKERSLATNCSVCGRQLLLAEHMRQWEAETSRHQSVVPNHNYTVRWRSWFQTTQSTLQTCVTKKRSAVLHIYMNSTKRPSVFPILRHSKTNTSRWHHLHSTTL